jgi:lipoprotein-anchoring transpeptidase ErfK/SrfK
MATGAAQDRGRFRSLARGLATAALLVLAALPLAPGPADAGTTVVPRTLGPSTRTEIALPSTHAPGTVLISTTDRTLDLVIGDGRALRYRIGVGRDGFGWTGTVRVGAKAEWPFWRPPAEMRARTPNLPEVVPPGPLNPLGARAVYLHINGRDTLFRIHGTNEPETIGQATSSGCFRMTNTDVIDLYDRVKIGAVIVVN